MSKNLLKLGRIIPIIVVTIVIGAVFFSYFQSNQPVESPQSQEVQILPKEVTDLTEGFTVFQSEQGQTTLEVKAKLRLGFKGGKSLLEGVSATIFRKNDNYYDTISSKQCEVDHANGDIVFIDDVVITLANVKSENSSNSFQTIPTKIGIIKSKKLRFSRSSGQVFTKELVSLEKGLIRASGLGLIYDSGRDLIKLNSRVKVTLLPKIKGNNLVQLKADNLEYLRQNQMITLYSNVWVKDGKTELTALQLRVLFTPSGSQLSRMEARGNVKTKSLEPGTMLQVQAERVDYNFAEDTELFDNIFAQGNVITRPLKTHSLKEISAQQMTLDFPPNSQTINSLTAKGQVRILFSNQVTSKKHKSSKNDKPLPKDQKLSAQRILTSPYVQAYFTPGTSRVIRIEAVGPSTFKEIPNHPSLEQKILSAQAFRLFYKEPLGNLERFIAEGAVHFKMVPPSGPTRITTSHQLIALFNPQNHKMSQLQQTGNFTYQELSQRAKAKTAFHYIDQSLMQLKGEAEIENDTSKTQAEVIELHQVQKLVKAKGNVRSTYYQSGIYNGQIVSPIHASADLMEFHTEKRIGHYSNNAKFWGKDRVVYAEKILFDSPTKKLTASGKVTSIFSLPNEEGKSKHTTIKANRMIYNHADKNIFYQGQVETISGQDSLQSEQLNIFLNQENNNTSIKQIIAKGNVRITQQNRTSSSQVAEYFSQKKEVILWGGSPKIIDREQGSTTGAKLTIDLNDGTFTIQGNPDNRTVTRRRLSQ